MDGHPELVVDPSESRFFLEFLPKTSGLDFPGLLDLGESVFLKPRGRYLDVAGDHFKAYYSHLDPEHIVSLYRSLAASMEPTPANILVASVLAFGLATDQVSASTKHWVEKSIFNEWYVLRIYEMWPEARCIHLLRDPRDGVVSSRKRDLRHGRHPTSLGAYAYSWQRSARFAEAYEATKPGYVVIRYEDLVGDPRSTMSALAARLGIAWDECLLRPTKVAGRHPWGGNSSSGQAWSGIDAGSTEQWRSADPRVLAQIECLARRGMVRWRYRLSGPVSPSTYLAALPAGIAMRLRALRDVLRRGRS